MSTQPTPDAAPSAVLRDEHKVILRVIRVIGTLVERSKSGNGFEVDSLKQCVEFLRFFADACHHAKEEDLLFPMLESRGVPNEGGPIGVMLYEHSIARKLTAQMGECIEAFEQGDADAEARFRDAAGQYVELLTNHIYKEDNILFNMGDQVMTAEDQSDLCGKFCEVGCRAFGGRKREELEAIAADLEERWAAR
jgi:hemerythrin-like domain-containing protein